MKTMWKSIWMLLLFSSLAACATGRSSQPLGPGKETEAVRDYIVASDLPQVRSVRRTDHIKYFYVNDHFIIMPSHNDLYLLEMRGRCAELRQPKWTSDMIDLRVSTRVIQSGVDTIRGCIIGKIYELNEAQFSELESLGDAPGVETFIPPSEKA